MGSEKGWREAFTKSGILFIILTVALYLLYWDYKKSFKYIDIIMKDLKCTIRKHTVQIIMFLLYN